MRNDEPDYTSCTLDELLDASRTIDRERFAERAARLDAEIARRRAEGAVTTSAAPDGTGCAQYAVAFLSFVPLLGILAAMIAVGLAFVGARSRREATIAIACAGILFNVALYGSMFYFGLLHPVGPARAGQEMVARRQLSVLVREIEFFRIQNGRYPNDLEELKTIDPKVQIYDTTRFSTQLPPFFYRRTTRGYYLLSPGRDRKPFTSDDLLPDMPDDQLAKTGFRRWPAS